MRARREHELGQVGGAFSSERRERFPDLERVAHRLPERLAHVRQLADDVAACFPPERDHRLGEHARIGDRLHECAVADLHVEHDRVRAGGDLLRHDAGRDQRHAVDGRGHVAQPIQLLVRGHEVRGLPDDCDPDVAYLRDELFSGQLDAKARYRLELVERAAGVTEPAAAHLPERDAARGDDRADGERCLVPHAARRVLVDDAPAERLADVDLLPAAHHRVRERERLAARHPAEVDGHAERGELVVGDVAEDELVDLALGELAAVALALDELRDASFRGHEDRHGPS